MKKIVLAAAAASILFTSMASAADLGAHPYTKAPAPIVAAYNWTGFYIGGQVGGAWSDYGWDNITLTAEPVANNASSIVGGGHAGYNWQFNQIVIGVEAEASAADLTGSSRSLVNPAVTYSTKADWYATVVGRLGVAFGRAMVYGTGGVAFADFQTRGVNAGFDSFSSTSQRTGWTAGIGLAYQITPNWIAGIDYKHLQFDKYNVTGITNTLLLPYTVTGVDARIDQVTARISYKFGGPVVAKY
jgi:outer membrane immunogenic protein